MKDFRSALGSSDSSSAAPQMGGDAFHLPSILPVTAILTSIGSVLGISSLALMFRPWRILGAIPFRRGGGISSIFAWGRLAALMLAAGLFFAPQVVQNALPEWRQVALFCTLATGVSVLAAISRCCGSVLSCAFWVTLTLFLGQKAAVPGTPTGSEFALSSLPQILTPQVEQNQQNEEWEDMVTGRPVSFAHVTQVTHAPATRRAHAPRAPIQAVNSETSPGIFEGISASLVNQLESSIGTPAQALGFTPQSNSIDWRDGEALPESAYFGNPAKLTSVLDVSGSGGGSASPIDQVIDKVSSFIK